VALRLVRIGYGDTMRLFLFSDWRSQPVNVLFEVLEGLEEPVDLILYGGDDLHRFGESEGGRNILSELADEARLGRVLAVAGNDDTSPSQSVIPRTAESSDPQEVLSGDGVIDLHQNPVVENGYVFLGLEGATEGGPGITLYSEEEIESHLNRQYEGFQDKVPILLSHTPPKGVLDIGQRFGQRHIGSNSVREFVEEVEPPLTVCGHCHLFGGRAKEQDFGTVVNIASHDDRGAKGRYAVVEVDDEVVEYELKTTDSGIETELLNLSQVGGRRAKQFDESGFTELDDISEERREELLDLPGVYDWHIDMWLEEAEAIRNDEIRVRDRESFSFLKNDNLVLVDIETDLSQDHIWLVGLYSYRDQEYIRIFEKDDEERLLECFTKHLREQGEPTIVYYGNNRFDEKCLRRRMSARGLTELDLLDNAEDLGIAVHNHLLGSFNRTNLEALSKILVDYEYTYPELDGFGVGSKFTRYKLDGEEPDWEKLIEYNRDDVMAMKQVVDRIRDLL